MLKWFGKRKTFESSVKITRSPHSMTSQRSGTSVGSLVNNQNQENEDVPEVSSSSDLTDADYEFLFNQLLDGVAHGWNQLRIIKFFQNLGTRGEEAHWVAWLEKFSTKIPDVTNNSQRRLGTIMLRLAEVTQSASELSQLSAISSQIGKKLFFGKTANLVWEYDGLDVVFPSTSAIDSTTEDGDNSIEKNITSILEPIRESTVEESSELENIKSPQSEESLTAISESTEAESSELDNLESPPPEESVTAIPESTEVESSELDNLESPPPEESVTAIPEATEVESSEIAPTVTNSSENQEIVSSQFSQLETTGEHSSNPAVMEFVESWFNLGLKQASAGDFQGAIDSWHKALKLNPNLAEIWHNLGSALGRLEQYPEAIESFNHALEIDPQSYQAWNDRAHAFYQMQQWEQAINSWNKAITLDSENYLFWYHRGCALEQLQRFDEAIVSYEKALEISPDFQSARSKYVNLVTKS